MSFKSLLKKASDNAMIQATQRRQEYSQSLVRTDEQWPFLDEIIQELILKEVNESDGDEKWINIPKRVMDLPSKENGEHYYFPDDEVRDFKNCIRITHMDIDRFCKQHHLKMRYILLDRWDRKFYEKNYSEETDRLYGFRIKIKYWFSNWF